MHLQSTLYDTRGLVTPCRSCPGELSRQRVIGYDGHDCSPAQQCVRMLFTLSVLAYGHHTQPKPRRTLQARAILCTSAPCTSYLVGWSRESIFSRTPAGNGDRGTRKECSTRGRSGRVLRSLPIASSARTSICSHAVYIHSCQSVFVT